MPNQYVFLLPDISCHGCVANIDRVLSENKKDLGITNFEVNLADKILHIDVSDDSQSEEQCFERVSKVLSARGYTLERKKQEERAKKKPLSPHWILGLLGTLLGLTMLILSLAMGALPLAAMIAMACISVPLTLFLGARSIERAVKALKEPTLTMDTLFAISTITILAVSIAAFFVPWLPMMFDAGLLIFGFRHIGIAIRDSINKKLYEKKSFRAAVPNQVLCLNNGIYSKKLLKDVVVTDQLKIMPGEIIPVDGIALSDTVILEENFTGSHDPTIVKARGQLLAGMYLAKNAQPLEMQVTAIESESTLAHLDKTISRAREEEAPLKSTADKILVFFIIGIIGLSILSGVLVGLFFTPALAIQCAVAVLVSACPCTLGLITPLALKIGMDKARNHAVVFHSPEKMEAAAKIDTVFFDLNGTLTSNELTVRRHGIVSNKISEADFFAYTVFLEERASHKTAQVICEYVKSNQNKTPLVASNNDPAWNDHRFGVGAMINEKACAIGNEDMMRAVGIDVDEFHRTNNIELQAADSLIYLARGKDIVGYFIVSDPLRKDARLVVKTLQDSGKDVFICTGASQKTALRRAKELGIDEEHVLFSRALCPSKAGEPSRPNKVTDIKSLQLKKRRVAMIGDGGNDSPSLAACHFGIALASAQKSTGREVAQDNAGVVLHGNSLMPVLKTFAVAEQTITTVKQNLLFSLLYNLGSMLLASGLLLIIGFVLNPGIGVALMVVQSLLVLLNTYRFKKQDLPQIKEKKSALPQKTSYDVIREKTPGSSAKHTGPLSNLQDPPTTPLFSSVLPVKNSGHVSPEFKAAS